MPVPNGKIETDNCKKQRKWSLIGILSKKKKLKKSQESVDFCPYDGKINRNVARNNHLSRPADCLIEQYTRSPKLIGRRNSLQCSYAKTATSQPALNEWKLSQQSVYSSSSSACYSDVGGYKRYGYSGRNNVFNDNRYVEDENEPPVPAARNVPSKWASEIGSCRNKNEVDRDRQRYATCSVKPTKLIGKKIPPPPPPRDPNVKAMYYIRNNRLVSRESDSTYFSQSSDDSVADKHEKVVYGNEFLERGAKEPPRSRRPIQISDVETLSTESEPSEPRAQTAEEAIRELEDIYNSLGLSDEDLLDRAERRDLPTPHQHMRYESFDELDCVAIERRVLPTTRRSGVPDIVADDMAYRRLNKKEKKRKSFAPGSFLLVLPTVYNLDYDRKPSGGEPDITLDDVVFRSRRQHLNFLKIADPQPPFGIPLGPIVGAAPSDYLHAVPEGRYKPSFHPRKMPDTVEDDLAYRTLRKDPKYKTSCIDFSFVRKNPFEIDELTLKRNRIKNDTHWIVKTEEPSAARCRGKSRVELVFNGPVTDDRQKLILVKIDHHKPIMLTAFGLDQLSKSLICTNLLSPHEPRKITCSTATLNRLPPTASQLRRSDYHYRSNGVDDDDNDEPTTTTNRCPRSSSDHRLMMTNTRLDDDGGGDGILTYSKDRIPAECQPNFRALIRREHARRYRPSFAKNANSADGHHIHVVAGHERQRHVQNGIESRLVTDDNHYYAPNSSVMVAARPSAADSLLMTSTKELYEEDPSPSAMMTDGGGDATSRSAEYPPNRSPGYLEVCLYITIYVYQLFSVNAYSTFIALIFLVALHVCRRLS